MLLVAVNPAKLLSERFFIKNANNINIDEFECNDGKIIFTGNQSQYTIFFENFRDVLKSTITAEYFLEIKIKYKAINSNIIYTYESKSKYNPSKLQWDLISENTD